MSRSCILVCFLCLWVYKLLCLSPVLMDFSVIDVGANCDLREKPSLFDSEGLKPKHLLLLMSKTFSDIRALALPRRTPLEKNIITEWISLVK